MNDPAMKTYCTYCTYRTYCTYCTYLLTFLLYLLDLLYAYVIFLNSKNNVIFNSKKHTILKKSVHIVSKQSKTYSSEPRQPAEPRHHHHEAGPGLHADGPDLELHLVPPLALPRTEN